MNCTGNLNVLAFIGGVFFILTSIGIFITVVCFAGRKRRNRQTSLRGSDKKRGKYSRLSPLFFYHFSLSVCWKIIEFLIVFTDISIEMETSLDIQSVAGTESSFKYPKEPLVEIEPVCTIEKMVIPPPPPPPSSIVKITTRSCH